jgi:hypothetical protein
MTYTRSLPVRNALSAVLIAFLFGCAAVAVGQSEFLVYSFPYSFPSMPAGSQPRGNLVADKDGNLYGTAQMYGTGAGTVFKLTRPVPPKEQWTETVLYSFTGDTKASSDAGFPQSGVIFDAAGNLYGVAAGGANGLGAVFKLSPPSSEGGQWTESVLHSFAGGLTDGALVQHAGSPDGELTEGVVFDDSGNLYGVTEYGGSGLQEFGYCQYGCGVVYELSPPATPGGAWTEKVLHAFKARQGAVYAVGTPIFDGKGNLYGATHAGPEDQHSIKGAAYRLTPPSTAGGSWVFKLLYSFSENDVPQSSLTFHNNGRLYGTTVTGGIYHEGTVFELVPPAVAGDAWTESILHNFGNGTDGAEPLAKVVFDKAGNLYSTTAVGGSGGTDFEICQSRGCGTVFELSPPTSEGGDWTETILHSFAPPTPGTDGSLAVSGLMRWKNGVLFGVTPNGGRGSVGAVYGVVP